MVTAHRGASGYLPEHTLAAFQLAIDLGADSIELDLVSTGDGVLVARHESDLGRTTDVARRAAFAGRRTTKTIDGHPVTGWFAEDFTLAELKTLRAREPRPDLRPGNTVHDGLHEIPTLQEVLDLADAGGAGVFAETKHPAHFADLGLALEEPLLATVAGHRGQLAVQSFDAAHLLVLAGLSDLPLVQLLDRTARAGGLAAVARYATAVGVHKNLIVPRDTANRLQRPTDLVGRAHAAGLTVHAWTFRRENTFLPEDFRVGDPDRPDYLRSAGDLAAELRLFLELGVDRVVTDNPDLAVAAVVRAGAA